MLFSTFKRGVPLRASGTKSGATRSLTLFTPGSRAILAVNGATAPLGEFGA